MDDARLNAIIDAVVRELLAEQATRQAAPAAQVPAAPARAGAVEFTTPVLATRLLVPAPDKPSGGAGLQIDLPDPTDPRQRSRPGIQNPLHPQALEAMIASTTARIGVGRAGPRYRTTAQLLLQADHAVTQDALMRDVDQRLLDEFGLFTVQTRVTGGKQQYLLRPDLGRQLSDEARRMVADKCTHGANIQLVIGDGLSAAAIEANLRQIMPVIRQGAESARISLGTPFFVKYCRVGVLNDIGDILQPDVVVLLIGERPGLGRAESMSAYMAYRPKSGDSDADRNVICNIFEGGGTNPLEAGAVVIQMAQNMLRHQASGVKLRLAAQ
ncbi:MAG TPA: ethanolamine ammonia-lyase subunit EutC [Anaerolineaceae bacterium]